MLYITDTNAVRKWVDEESAMKSPKVGQLLQKGKYEIRKHIGSGRFGEVFLAMHHQLSGPVPVAIKWFSEDVLSRSDFGIDGKIHLETALLSKIKHPAVVSLIGIEIEKDSCFLVEEFLEGGNLKEYIPEFIGLSKDEFNINKCKKFVEIALALCNGLDAVHSQGFFHGDIKPNNICFRDSEKSEPVLVDFGQSGVSDEALLGNSTHQVAATLRYLPPERTGFVKVSGNAVSDLYSLGVSLYELAAGVELFNGQSTKEIVTLILSHVPDRLCLINDHFSEQISDIIQKLIRKNPADRYHTAAGVAADLEKCHGELLKHKMPSLFALGRKDKIRELNYKIPMIGRDFEMTFLSQLISDTLNGNGKLVFIGAPSGTGKTRLAAEFSMMARSFGFRIFSSKFSEYERNVPLSAIGVALQEYAIWLRQQPADIREKWKFKISKDFAANGSVIAGRFSYLSDLLPEFAPLPKMTKDEEAQLFFKTVAVFLTYLNADCSGYVIFLDDLQWSDAESLQIVQELQILQKLNKLGNTLFVGTYRNDEVLAEHPLEINVLKNITEGQKIILAPLSVTESDKLVHHLIDEEGLEVQKLAKTTFYLTRGNPFYIYEYLKSAISTGVYSLDKNGNKWIFDPSLAITAAMSRGALALVKDRICKLPEGPRQTVLIAGVLGNNIDINHFRKVVSECLLPLVKLESKFEVGEFHFGFEQWFDGENKLISDFFPFVCDKLRLEHLITNSAIHFSFFHDKIREAAYELLPAEARQPIHKCYGDILANILLGSENSGNKPSSKDIFEAAFHIMEGYDGTSSRISRDLLHLASMRAMDSFVYSKAKEYLSFASHLFDIKLTEEDKKQWVSIHTSLAHCLALNERLDEAIKLYEEILLFVHDPLQKAEIYAKLTEYNMQMFRHREASEAGIKGLGLLNETMIHTHFKAIWYGLYILPKFVFVLLYFKTFGKQHIEVETHREEIKFRLKIALLVALYFTRPLAAVPNQMIFTLEILFHKDSYYRNMMIIYWGPVFGAVGLTQLSRKCFSSGVNYFEKYHNPVAKGFLNFQWGYVCEFPAGNLQVAHLKTMKAFEQLSTVGESFWRSLSLQSKIHIDNFGAGNGDAAEAANQLIAIWRRVQFEPSFVGCVMKDFLFRGKNDEVEEWMQRTIASGVSIKKQGFDTIDTCYSSLAPGEIYLLRGENKEALPLLRDAFWVHMRHLHRVAFCTYSAALLAVAYIRLKKPIKAIIPLLFAWLNMALNVRIYRSQTWYVSAEFFDLLKLTRISDFCFKRGIAFAEKNFWSPIAAEGQMAFGKSLLNRNPIYAEGLIGRAKSYFNDKGNVFLANKCDQLSRMSLAHRVQIDTRHTDLVSPQNKSKKKKISGQKIDNNALLNRFLNLSAMTQFDQLIQTALTEFKNLAQCEIAILYLENDNEFKPYSALGLQIDDILCDENTIGKVDNNLVSSYIKSGKIVPEMRKNENLIVGKKFAESVLFFALVHNNHISAYCYLSDKYLDQVMDSTSLEILNLIAAQVSVALYNISMLKSVREKAEFELEWKAIQEAQETLLPMRDEKIPQIAVAYRYYPASKTGGDWINYFFNPQCNTMYLCVGDVTGHGFPSALITGVVYGAVFSCEYTSKRFEDKGLSTAEEHLTLIARSTNLAVLKTGKQTGRLVTMSFISIDIITGLVCYINAGHTPPLWFQNGIGKTKLLNNPSNRLGYSADSQFTVKCIQLTPGDSLCVFTDGLTENRGPDQSTLEVRQIKTLLESATNPEEACETIIEKGRSIWNGEPFEDDICLAVVKWEGVPLNCEEVPESVA